eukprot:6190388-Pleurochrysis_carterae.AAC.1
MRPYPKPFQAPERRAPAGKTKHALPGLSRTNACTFLLSAYLCRHGLKRSIGRARRAVRARASECACAKRKNSALAQTNKRSLSARARASEAPRE